MAWRRPGDKPLSEPMMVRLLTHICVTRPQCVKVLIITHLSWILFMLLIHETAPYYDDVIMGAMASQINSLPIVYSTVYSDADQRKHQSSESLAIVRGIHRGQVNSPHKWPVTRKMFPFDDVIMRYVWSYIYGIGMCKYVKWNEVRGNLGSIYKIIEKQIQWYAIAVASWLLKSPANRLFV